MTTIKRFDSLNEGVNSESFEKKKKEMINKLNDFMDEYEKFTGEISPKFWRSSGHHFTELKSFVKDIEKYTEMTKEEKEKLEDFEKKK